MSLILFAHAGHEHSESVNAATHNIPSLIGLTLLTGSILIAIYWLLTRNASADTQEESEE